jgi:ankyrin repeat protein
LDVTKVFLKKGADVKAANKDGNTPLHWAVRYGQLDVVKYLVEEKGADVNAANKDGNTPLHWAVRYGKWDIVKYLVEEKGADVNAANNDGNTPLHWAAEKGKLDVVKLLIEHGADLLTRNNHDTVLHRAVSGNSEQVIRIILNKVKEIFNQYSQQIYQYINSQDTEGDTPLMWATERGKVNSARTLLEYGVDIDVKNNDDTTALHWAAKNGHLDITQLLLEYNASVNIKDKSGKIPLDLAQEKLTQETIDYYPSLVYNVLPMSNSND